MAPKRVAVIGGGIIGMSSALRVIESIPGIEITVIAEKFTPNTTGDGSAGFWNPYLLGDIDPHRLRFWCRETFDFLFNIFQSPHAKTFGVGLLSAYELSEQPLREEPFNDVYIHKRGLTTKELDMFPTRYKYGSFFTTIYAECSKLLPQSMEKFKSKGGKIQQKLVTDLEELIDDYDILINCPGVEAANLVQDVEVTPIRGQTIRVYAPWIKHAIVSEDFYILPNSEVVICGGTHQKGDWNTNVNEADRRHIWEGCCEIMPSLKEAKILKEWVGLRPGRSKPRVERETLRIGRHKTIEVIHNYGHGGSGVTLFWGCAKDVVDQLRPLVTMNSHL